MHACSKYSQNVRSLGAPCLRGSVRQQHPQDALVYISAKRSDEEENSPTHKTDEKSNSSFKDTIGSIKRVSDLDQAVYRLQGDADGEAGRQRGSFVCQEFAVC